MALASRSNRSLNCSPETLIATSRFKRGISGTIHLSHPARADGREDFIWTEFVACRKRHLSIELSLADHRADRECITGNPSVIR